MKISKAVQGGTWQICRKMESCSADEAFAGVTMPTNEQVINEADGPIDKDIRELRPALYSAMGWHHWAAHERSQIASCHPANFALF